MKNLSQTVKALENGEMNAAIVNVYGENELNAQVSRFLHLTDLFKTEYSDGEELRFFSAPGRTEVCGNHTDHNHGKVLAAAINLDALALACKNDSDIISIKSEGYPGDRININELTPVDAENGHSAALVRGVAARFVQLGYKIGGLNAVTVNNVLKGSGMSSSASYEVLVGTILNYLYNDGSISAVEIAKIAQYAENEFFGKPCGLMDQMACSVGSFVKIDFADTSAPVIEPVDFNFGTCGHNLCIVDTHADHADLTDDYAAIRSEMEAVAGFFGKNCLREITGNDVIENAGAIREKLGERPLLRAIHFFEDNKRVDIEAKALSENDFETFKKNVIASGNSSYMYNQNIYSAKYPMQQPVALALALSHVILGQAGGAWRVHGGGFAGTIQAFVPSEKLAEYKTAMENLFGEGSCYVLSIRPFGGTEI